MLAQYYPDSASRAADFARHDRLPSSYTRTVKATKAQELVGQCESLFNLVSSKPLHHNAAGEAVLTHNLGELRASYTGNVQRGTLVVTRGHSHFTRVEFRTDRVTVFQSGNSGLGALSSDVAAVVSRKAQRASVAYGQLPELSELLQSR